MKSFILLVCALNLSASGVAISTITCSSGTVTVSCTTCGIVQYQGFSVAGSSVSTYNLNSSASTAATNNFTFALPSGTSCNGSATGGTVTPAKQIINVGSSTLPSSGNIVINYVFWFTTIKPVPLTCNLGTGGNQCPTSIWSGASAAENAAIVAGTTIEFASSLTVGATTPAATIESNLITNYNAIETAYSAGLLAGLGYWYNGTSWVNQ